MANSPFGTSSTSSPFSSRGLPGGGIPAPHAHGVGGFFQNLGGDIVNAVTGLVPGAIHLVEHPIGGIKGIGKGIWQTWSPLFNGHFGKFASGVYQHPLAPMLDVASLLDLGIGSAGRLGEALGAPEDSLLGRAAALRTVKEGVLKDQLGTRHDLSFEYSRRPLRRLTQERVAPAIAQHLPENVTKGINQLRYEHAFAAHMTSRVLGKAAVLTSLMKAGKELTDPVTAPAHRMRLGMFQYLNLLRNAPVELQPSEAIDYLQSHSHYGVVKDMGLLNRDFRTQITRLSKQEARWQTHRAANAELAHSLPNIRAELDHQNALLKEMNDKGFYRPPAQTKLKEPTVKQRITADAIPRKELEGNIKRLEQQLARAHTAKKIHDRATQELGRIMGQRMDLERRSTREYFSHIAHSPESFERWASDFGRHAVMGSGSGRMTRARAEAIVAHAAKTSRKYDSAGNLIDYKVRLVPKHDATMLGKELSGSHHLLRWMVQKPTQLWKSIQVGFTPRTLTNVGLGNALIYMLRSDPISGTQGLFDAMRAIHGAHKAGDVVMRGTPFRSNSFLFRYHSPELHNVFGHEMIDQATKTGRIKAVKSGFYPLVHKLGDEPLRMAAIAQYYRSHPLVQQLMRDKHLTLDQAVTRAVKQNRGLIENANHFARSIVGDYQTLRPWEQKLRNIAPFYTWDRHAMRSTGNIVADTPTRAVAMQQVSNQGNAEVKKLLGDVPEFMQGWLPMSMLGLDTQKRGSGRADVLGTSSINPFTTAGDVAQLLQQLTVGGTKEPGSALFSQVNPLAEGLIAAGTGTDPMTGAKVPTHGGAITTMGANIGANLPEFRLINALTSPTTTVTPKGKAKMFAQDRRTPVTSLFGFPVRNVDLAATEAAAKKELGIKSSRSRKKSPFG